MQLFQLLVVCALCVGTIYCQCSAVGQDVLQRRRLQSLRAGILNQLGLTEESIPPPSNETTNPVPSDLLESYNVLVEARETLRQENRRKCQLDSDDVFAQPISTIVGTATQTKSLHTRSIESDIEPTILSSYELEFALELDEELEDVTKADLLLYQIPIEDYEHSVMDSTQYVEIKIVLRSLGITTVVTGRDIDIGSRSYQAFDILPAVKLWIARRAKAEPMVLEVVITCQTSSTCGEVDQYGNEPHAIQFETGASGSEKAPRLIITSKNALESSDRARRQTSSTTFCSDTTSSHICCIEQLTIYFEEDLGLSMIHQPVSFDANYCDGICPLAPVADRLDIETPMLFNFLTQLSGTPAASVEPCCAGSSYESLTVLVSMPSGYEIAELQNVKVTGCQCG